MREKGSEDQVEYSELPSTMAVWSGCYSPTVRVYNPDYGFLYSGWSLFKRHNQEPDFDSVTDQIIAFLRARYLKLPRRVAAVKYVANGSTCHAVLNAEHSSPEWSTHHLVFAEPDPNQSDGISLPGIITFDCRQMHDGKKHSTTRLLDGIKQWLHESEAGQAAAEMWSGDLDLDTMLRCLQVDPAEDKEFDRIMALKGLRNVRFNLSTFITAPFAALG